MGERIIDITKLLADRKKAAAAEKARSAEIRIMEDDQYTFECKKLIVALDKRFPNNEGRNVIEQILNDTLACDEIALQKAKRDNDVQNMTYDSIILWLSRALGHWEENRPFYRIIALEAKLRIEQVEKKQ